VTIGDRVGRYELRSVLGRGGMGEVYEAFDARLRRRVAIKHIRSGPGDDERRRARLRREARVVAQLAHPCIVQVFDIIEREGGDWIVMELVLGDTLAARLASGPMAVGPALRCARDIADALSVAHRQGIVHRDLKVENVMLTAEGRVKVLDFGIAKQLGIGAGVEDLGTESLSGEGQVIGTIRTMSPEQARGMDVDERSDLFSLGVLLYEAIAGISPFLGATPMDTLLRVSTHRQPPLAELSELAEAVPPALSALVDQLLEKARELRPASAAEVVARLDDIAGSRAVWSRSTESMTAAAAGATETLPGAGAPASREIEPPASRDIEAPATRDTGALVTRAPAPAPARPRRRLLGLGIAGALGCLGVAAALLWPERPAHESPALPATPAAPTAQIAVPEVTAGDPRAWYEQGMAHLRQYHRPGEVEVAIAQFQRLLQHDESSAAGHAGLARAYYHRYIDADTSADPMFLEQAMQIAARAVALDPMLADARVSRGLAALELGHMDEAERDFRAALELAPDSADAYNGLARVYQRRQRFDEAEAAYRAALARAPQARQLHDDLGALLVNRGRYEEAVALFERSIALAPDNIYGYSNLGAARVLQGRYTEAAAAFQDALKIRASASLYNNLGTVLFAQGLYAPAANAFERALAMDGAANYYLHWGNLADAYRQLPGAAEQARAHYLRAVQLLHEKLARAPGDATLRSRRALYLARAGDCARAREDLDTLAEVEVGAPHAMFRRAVALELCAQRDRAIELLDEALALGLSAAELEAEPDLRALRSDPDYHRMRAGRDRARAP
jgi:tetratricopeptide (TPR) repeat protein/tRNA A-37 threonylcarbamoyl transferase component Bud32